MHITLHTLITIYLKLTVQVSIANCLLSHFIQRMAWFVVDGEADWDDWWPWWVWVGECFFSYQLTRVVPDKFHRAV